jgi:hypothetical protein
LLAASAPAFVKATLANMPALLDLNTTVTTTTATTDVEEVLRTCLVGMQRFPPNASSTATLAPPPSWVYASTAPTDWAILQRAKELRDCSTTSTSTSTTSSTSSSSRGIIMPNETNRSSSPLAAVAAAATTTNAEYPLVAVSMGLLWPKQMKLKTTTRPRWSTSSLVWVGSIILALLTVANYSTHQQAWIIHDNGTTTTTATIPTTSTSTSTTTSTSTSSLPNAPAISRTLDNSWTQDAPSDEFLSEAANRTDPPPIMEQTTLEQVDTTTTSSTSTTTTTTSDATAEPQIQKDLTDSVLVSENEEEPPVLPGQDDVIPDPVILETVQEDERVVLSGQDQNEEKDLRSANDDIDDGEQEEQPKMASQEEEREEQSLSPEPDRTKLYLEMIDIAKYGRLPNQQKVKDEYLMDEDPPVVQDPESVELEVAKENEIIEEEVSSPPQVLIREEETSNETPKDPGLVEVDDQFEHNDSARGAVEQSRADAVRLSEEAAPQSKEATEAACETVSGFLQGSIVEEVMAEEAIINERSEDDTKPPIPVDSHEEIEIEALQVESDGPIPTQEEGENMEKGDIPNVASDDDASSLDELFETKLDSADMPELQGEAWHEKVESLLQANAESMERVAEYWNNLDDESNLEEGPNAPKSTAVTILTSLVKNVSQKLPWKWKRGKDVQKVASPDGEEQESEKNRQKNPLKKLAGGVGNFLKKRHKR